MPSTFTTRDLCERYGVSEHTVLSWINQGDIRAINVGRRTGAKKPRWRFREEDVVAFEQLRTPSLPAPRAPRRKRPDTGVIEFYK
jgi:excisionase family DNA binding protein